MKIENSIFKLLEMIGVVDRQSIEKVQSFVRDNPNISVYKCNKSGEQWVEKKYYPNRSKFKII